MTEKILNDLMKVNLEQVEVYTKKGWKRNVTIKNSSIHSYKEEFFNYHIIRAFKDKKKSTFSFEEWNKKFRDYIYETTMNSEPDKHFHSLPSPEKLLPVEGIYSPSVRKIEGTEILNKAGEIIRKAKGIHSSVVLSGLIEVSFEEREIMNSLGVQVKFPLTFSQVELEAIIWDKNGAGSFYDSEESHDFNNLIIEKLPHRVVEGAKRYLLRKNIKTGVYPVILSPLSTFLFLRTLSSSLNAENVWRKRSFMEGKLGEKIASPLFSLTDNGNTPGGLYSSPSDDEGLPHKKIKIFENGVLKTYLHNSYTSNKFKVENTRHASLGGGISPTNLSVERGKREYKEIIKDIKEGIFLDIVSLSPHPVSGDFSVPLDFSMKIENGEITYPIRGAMAGGNFLELLKSISEISKDYRSFPGNPSPYILIDKVNISGS